MDRVFGGYGAASVGFGFLMASLAFLRSILPKELVAAAWDYILWLTSLYIHIHIYELTSQIEDIDCSIELKKRGEPAPEVKEASSEDKDSKKVQPRITLSGLLNFTDGLWSSCGSERIIIFTTNHVDQLDPALLRPGRMDVKLELSYATFGAFKVLARTYLRISEHDLFDDIKTLFSQEDVQITPAAVAGVLVRNGGEDDPEAALQGLIEELQDKKAKTSPELESEVYLSLS